MKVKFFKTGIKFFSSGMSKAKCLNANQQHTKVSSKLAQNLARLLVQKFSLYLTTMALTEGLSD